MTPKQARFVEEYLVDLNATQAAIRAGYSAKRAQEIGYQQLQKTPVQQALMVAQRERSARTGITADRVVKEIARVAFSDMRKLMTWGPSGVSLVPSDRLDDESAAAVSEVSETVTKDGGSLKLKLHNKVEALEKLARHVGLYDQRGESVYEIVRSYGKVGKE